MKTAPVLAAVLLLFLGSLALAQSQKSEPEIGYLYPAGGRAGTVVRVLVGGQNLRGAGAVLITGKGVKASVVRYQGRYLRLNAEERKALRLMIVQARKNLMSGGRPQVARDEGEQGRGARDKPGGGRKNEDGLRDLAMHPLLGALDQLTLDELEFVERKYVRSDPREQLNAQIGETAMIELDISADAEPGDRELRLVTAGGITNPRVFQIGLLPEFFEKHPADHRPSETGPFEVPAVFNGQITPGDEDRFSFKAASGSKLVIRVSARSLSPFLADAVPGWFQSVISLIDPAGREVAFADDFLFDPDPVLFFEPKQDGVHRIEIRDSIHRGRDDFVYRISVSGQPFVTGMFPMGCRAGSKAAASLEGFNLGSDSLALDSAPGPIRVRSARLTREAGVSNAILFAVDDLPETFESEPNDSPQAAQPVAMPVIVNGRISAPGDRDFFRIECRSGQAIVAEIVARRLHSPLDSIIRIRDGSGKALAANDDFVFKTGHLHRDMGVLTHHADSYLRFTPPEDGFYIVEVGDSQCKGSPDHAYRLRLSEPAPDFDLLCVPSGVNMQPGHATVITVHALKRDGFDGSIEVSLADATQGFTLQGGRIPPGRDSIRMTLTAPLRRMDAPVSLRLEGSALIAGATVRRPVQPADDMMQAFLWRHLVPAREMIAAVSGRGGRGDSIEIVGNGPVGVAAGGSALVRIKTPLLPDLDRISLEPSEPPKGVAISDVKVLPRLIQFRLAADESAAGVEDNLIVHVFLERPADPAKGRKAGGRLLIGMLPAVMFKVEGKTEPVK